MEEEAREILKAALSLKIETKIDLAQAIRRHVIPLGGVELNLQAREPVRRPVKLA
jgi:plasmid stability protein